MPRSTMPLPLDYSERVYAGVLGKIIGVYLGRPFEGWPHARIVSELGQIEYYVHQRLGLPLIVTDDDLSGTFTFVRALADNHYPRDLTPAQIGEAWLNYIIENRTILWWGGLGNSTEHTAYLRLQQGIAAPASGSIALNGPTVAEQIGAQIFIDGWAMVAPGDPALAADLARRAASVSHDGEAIYAAQVLAAMEAQAFVETDIDRLLDTAIDLIPPGATIRRLIDDLRERRAAEPDWRKTLAHIQECYGYDKYLGNCHIVPNHGLVLLGLLYGGGDFHRSLSIVNTAGWDTDCNSGNLGCLLGLRNGLAAFEGGPDWRRPVADRLYLSTADGGRAVADAVTETFHLVNAGRALAGLGPVAPKARARFHFELPGALQGFQAEADSGPVYLDNVLGYSQSGQRSLAIRCARLEPGRWTRVGTPTFIPPEALSMPGYELLACPTLYPGQTVKARLSADSANTQPFTARLYLACYGGDDQLAFTTGPAAELPPGAARELAWRLDEADGAPIARVGVELSAAQPAEGSVYLDYLTWDGTPDVRLGQPAAGGTVWRRAWVNGADRFEPSWYGPHRVIQNHGLGLVMQGTREWQGYAATVSVRPHLAEAAGLGVCVQGLRRYYALLLSGSGRVRLVKALEGDRVLAEADFAWQFETAYELKLQTRGPRLSAWIDGQPLFEIEDAHRPLLSGAVALLCREGCTSFGAVRVSPATGR